MCMFNSNKIGIYVMNKYSKMAARRLQEKRKTNPKAELTHEDQEALNAELETSLRAELLWDTPTVDPAIIAKVYKRAIPDIKLVPAAERQAREDKRIRAARSYATSLVKVGGYQPGYGEFDRPRAEQRACLCMTQDELARYAQCHEKIDRSYYRDKNMSEEEIAQAIRENKKEISHLVFNSIKRAIDNYGDALSRKLSDDELIEQYPELVTRAKLITEAHALLNEAKEYQYEDITPEQIDEYDKKVVALMTDVPMLEKRMALLADPYYPIINLETLLDADPYKLDNLNNNIEEWLEEEDIEVEGEPNKAQPEVPDEAKPEEPEADDAHPSVSGKDKYDKSLKYSENILSVAGDIAATKMLALDRKIASKLGMSYDEMADNMVFCDRNGKIRDIHSKTAAAMLDETGGEFYVMSKFGDMQPMPVLLNKNKNTFDVLVGAAEIAAAKTPEPKEPAKPGWMASFANWIYEGARGVPTETVRKYREAKAKYDIDKQFFDTRKHLIGKQLPAAVGKLKYEITEKNQQLAKQRPTRLRNVENDLIAMTRVPEDDAEMFDYTLGDMLVNKAFAEPSDSMFRTTVFEMLGAFDPKFDELNTTDKLRKSDQFKEFTWRLRQTNPELIADLKSGDMEKANVALTKISEKFKENFAVNQTDRWSKSVSDEYKQIKEAGQKAQKAAESVQEGQVVSENDKVKMEEFRDNALHWRSIQSFYGAKREMRPDWMRACSSKSVYNMDDWRKMQEKDIDITTLRPEDKPMDDKTFAALGMMLSLRKSDFFTPENMKTKAHMPDSMPFEDIVSTQGEPRPNSRQILEPIVEPTREKLLDYLSNMDEDTLYTKENGEVIGNGKDMLAKDLTDALHIYVNHIAGFGWDDRTHSAMAEVCDKVMDFAEKHNMMDMLKKNGLTDQELENIKIVSAMGKISNAAHNAEDDLRRDHEGTKKLTEEERLDCLDKIMLLKAIQADVNGSRKEVTAEEAGEWKKPERLPNESDEAYNKRANNSLVEYGKRLVQLQNGEIGAGKTEFSPTAKNILDGGLYLKDLSNRMLPAEKRKELAHKGSAAIFNTVRCTGTHSMSMKWKDYIKENQAGEARRRMEIHKEQEAFHSFEERLNQLREKAEFKAFVTAADKVMCTGAHESKKLLAGMSDANLQRCNQALEKNPDIDFDKALQAHAKKESNLQAPQQDAAQQKNAPKKVEQGPTA